MKIEAAPHWPAWAGPFLEALRRTAENGRLRPGVASDLVGLKSRAWPYRYRYAHSDFDSAWSQVAIYVRLIEEQRLSRRVRSCPIDSGTELD